MKNIFYKIKQLPIFNIMGKKSIKETFWSFLTKSLTFILFILLNAVLTQNLSVEDFGIWSLFLSVITIIFTLSYFGINSSTRKFVAQYNKTDDLRNVLLSSIKLRVIFSLIFSLLLFFFRKPIAILLNEPRLETLFLWGIPFIFLVGIVEYLKNVFMGLHRIKYNFILNTSEYTLKLLLILLFFLFSTTIISVISSFLIALFISGLLGLFLLYFNFYKDLKKSDKNFLKEILNYSYPLVFISIGFIALTEIDTLMLGIFSNSREVGIYAVAKQLIIKLPQIALAIAMGTMPVFAKLNNENKLELKQKFYNLVKINLVIFLIIVAGLIFLSPYFFPLIFGEEYSASVLPLQILTIYLFLSANSIFLGNLLDYTGRAKKRAFNISFCILANIVLNLILIPIYGAVGAAFATSISYMPYFILNLLEVRKVFK